MNVSRSTLSVLCSLCVFTVFCLLWRTLLLHQFNRLKEEVSIGLKEELREGMMKEAKEELRKDIEKDVVAKFKNDIGDIGEKSVAKSKNGKEDIEKDAVAKFKNDIGDIESEAKSKNEKENVQEQVEKWAKSIRGRKVTMSITMLIT